MSNSIRRLLRARARLHQGPKMNQTTHAPPVQTIEVQFAVEIAIDTKGFLHCQFMHGRIPSRAMLNLMMTTAHQDLLAVVAQAERAAREKAIEVAPPGMEVDRNPKA